MTSFMNFRDGPIEEITVHYGDLSALRLQGILSLENYDHLKHIPKPALQDIHNVISIFKTILKKNTKFNVSEAVGLFEEATGVNFIELFPQGNEELPKLFESLPEFEMTEAGEVSLKIEAQENLENLKKEYLITANDKKKKRVDPKMLTGATHPEAIALID